MNGPGRKKIAVTLAIAAALVLLLCLGLTPSIVTGIASSVGDNALANAANCGEVGLAQTSNVQIDGLSDEQVKNATVIVAVGRGLKIPPRGWVIAVATAMQESTLHNRGTPTDHDSVGLFQQRPSSGWGTAAQILDPRYASAKFYEKLLRIPNWERLRLTDAAQAVQISAYPDRYQRWEPLATVLVNRLSKGMANGVVVPADNTVACASVGQVSGAGWSVPAAGSVGSGFREGGRPNHNGVDMIASRNTPIRAASAGIVITVVCNASNGNCDVDGGVSVKGCGWYVEIAHGANIVTRYCHMVRRPAVTVGQRVVAGQQIGLVGSSGNSSGPHLHFEVHLGLPPTSSNAIDPVSFMAQRGAPLNGRQ